MGGSDFFAGQKVEYYSPSFNEWIECRVAQVRPDGQLKLEHLDGGGTLKEAADPSRVRPAAGGGTPGGKAAGAPPKAAGAVPGVPARRPGGPPPVGGAKAGGAPPLRKAPGSSPSAPSLPGAGDATPRSKAPIRPSTGPTSARGGAGAGGGAKAGGPPSQRGSVGGGGPPSSAPPLRSNSKGPPGKAAPFQQDRDDKAATIAPKGMYVGDRVKLKASGRTGEIMYIGPAQFAGGDVVVGIKLDEKRTSSDCDGKYKNERYFRCQPGFGIYQEKAEVELVPPEQDDEEIKALSISPPPADVEAFDLDTELQQIIGLSEAKEGLRHVRNFIEVQRRRMAVVGDGAARALHFSVTHGGPGSGVSAVGRLLGGLLLKMGVLSTGQVVEVTRKDLLSGCSGGDVEARLKKVARAAEGGVLLISDADALKEPEKSDRLGEETCVALEKLVEGTRGSGEWPQRLCCVFAGRRGELKRFLSEQPSIAGALYAQLELSDFSASELAGILRKLVEEHKFQLCKDLTDERLEVLVRRRMSRAGSGGDGGNALKNVKLAKAMLEEAVSRQTDRVWAKETLSFTGLTALVEEDFVDRARDQSEAAEAALRKLDSIVGLKSVKEFVRSLYAQLQLEQQRRELGIQSSGGGATLHMVFQGNPGTGKTTVARVVADLMKALGLLRTGHLVEADRSALVAGYSGQTALKTKAVVESALGGVLFVDEAYALVSEDGKDSFGREALDTLIKLVEDYRVDLVVIIAGYSSEMAKLLDANPGLRSRFPTVLEFDDYAPEELLEIADQMLLQDVLVLSDAAGQRLKSLLTELPSRGAAGGGDPRANGNGRAVRNIIERAKRNQAIRLQRSGGGGKHSQEELCTLLPEDLDGCTG